MALIISVCGSETDICNTAAKIIQNNVFLIPLCAMKYKSTPDIQARFFHVFLLAINGFSRIYAYAAMPIRP